MINKAKVAIVCDWLTNLGGAERVVEDLMKAFPEATLYTSVYNSEALPQFKKYKIVTSFIQKLPLSKRKHQLYLGLMPYAFESFNLKDFDLVISSSFACAKGVITKPNTVHICYCHTPTRYVWDESHEYIKKHSMNKFIKILAKPILHKLRQWDKLAAERVDFWIANSKYIKRKIKKYYGVDAEVIYPGINISKTKINEQRDNFYMAVGRLTAYKKFDLVVKTFNELNEKLYIVGTGEMMKKLKKENKNPKTCFAGFVPDETLQEMYKRSKGLIFPQCEDFGLIPIEAQSFGCPVIAFAQGGAMETVKDKETGILFNEQTEKSLLEAIKSASNIKWNHKRIAQSVKRFESEAFIEKIKEFAQSKLR
jgi:glycosyltransferase involved in cell wall biosynthesis